VALIAVLVFASTARGGDVFTLEVDGPIFNPVLEYLKIALEHAERDKAVAVLLELDTPGGSLDTTKEIVQAILGAGVPVIVYVSPSGAGAMSAGTFITLAGHVAAMAPGTTIGAAHPVSVFGGEDDKNQVMEKKIENYAVSLIEAIAGQRGRNVAWAAEAVRDSSAITAEKALEKKVVDLVAVTREELLTRVDGRKVMVRGAEHVLATKDARLRAIEMTREQAFYFFLAQPSMIFVLLLVGIGGLYVEFTHPGVGVPSVVGVIALLLAFIGFSIVPINFSGAALMALGVGLLVAEIFVPSFGALGVGGMVCLVAGSLLLFHTVEAPGLQVNRPLIAATAVAFGATMLGIGTLVLRSQGRPTATGLEGMVGLVGVVRERLAPRGKVFTAGELWDAELSDGSTAEVGEEIEVLGANGLRLVVQRKGKRA
jgi:membrane-bound serine protease (ClpP class)